MVEFLQDYAIKQYLSIIPPKAGQRALHTVSYHLDTFVLK